MSTVSTSPSPTPQGTARRSTAPRGAIWLVAEREILSRLRSKAFVISTGILLLAALVAVLIGGMVSKIDQRSTVAVVGGASQVVDAASGLKSKSAPDEAAAKKMVRDGTVDAAVVPDASSPTKVRVLGKDSAPSGVMQSLSVTPPVTLLEKAAKNPLLTYFVAFGFGIVFFMSAFTFGQTIAQSVVEEKQTRVVEILLSTISARVLLTGKVLGNSVMAFAQIALIALLTTGALLVTGQDVLLANLGSSVIWFVVFFTIGFVMIAALYAGTAALVSRQEDVGSATAPVMMLVMLPYILIIVFNNNPSAQAILSYIPFSAPVGMPMRLFSGTAQWWEPLVSLIILAATTIVMILAGSRIYSNSLLRTGAKIKLMDALRG